MKFKTFLNEMVKLKKKQWVDFDLKQLDKETLDYLSNMYRLLYQEEQMDLSANSGEEIAQKYNAVFFMDIDEDKYPDLFIIYKKTEYGNKIALLGTDGQKEAKKELIRKTIELLHTNGWYIEASKKMEKILIKGNIPFVDDEEKVKKIIPKEIFWQSNGYYERKLSKVKVMIVKRIYGKPRV